MTNSPNRFVIYEPTLLVALDLEGCLRERDPAAEIVLAKSLAEARALVASGSVTLAVLHVASLDESHDAVPTLLMGDVAEEQPGRWPVLQRPFSAEDVAAAVLRLGVTARHVPV